MNPLTILSIVSNFAVFIPPPYGPLLAVIGKVLPLIEAGLSAAEAVARADPNLVLHLEVAADRMGLSVDGAANVLFVPGTPSVGPHYHGGPKS